MNWFSRLFVTEKSVDKLVDAAISTGDKIWYTDEEKEEGRQKVRDWYISLLGAMKPHNLAMRAIALVVAFAWVSHLLLSTIFYIVAFFWCGPEAEVCSPASVAAILDSQIEKHINEYWGVVIMFYFGAIGAVTGLEVFNKNKQ